MHQFDATLVGDTTLDLLLFGLPADLPPERELLVHHMELALGGSGAITAHNLASLGARVGFVTPKSDDLFASVCLRQLADAGVDLSHSVPLREPTGLTVLLQHERFRRAFTYPGNATGLRMEDLDLGYLTSARHFHLSSFFLQRELRDDVPRLFAALKAAGLTISLDTNDDPWNDWSSTIAESLRFVDILMPNEREVCRLAGASDLDTAIATMRRVVPILVVKQGAAGALVCNGSTRESQPAVRVNSMDAVGAGDSFNAGFLYGFLNDYPLSACLRLGNLAGAYSTTRPGGIQAFRDRAALHSFVLAPAAAGVSDLASPAVEG